MKVATPLAGALALAAALLAGPAAATLPEPTPAESIALGRALAARNCGMCHAIGKTGLSANPQAPPFRQLNRRMDIDKLGAGLAQGILTGHPAMPEFRFEPNEVVAIVRYLKAVQARTHVELAPARAAD
ncbi:cytochrome c [Phenylobacterium sp.]|uniref:c-type cytochrome n=1 Tax=Phenylobacterium sp. TaxID=1871053 RepID=UPI0025FF9DF8|nr:cytochrome c [Phenylobacterium sp.]